MKKHLFALSAAIYSVMSMTPCVFAEGSEEGDALPPFCADLALWTAITFVLVLIVLWKFAWGPIIEGLDKREQYVQDQRDIRRDNKDYERKDHPTTTINTPNTITATAIMTENADLDLICLMSKKRLGSSSSI